MLKWKAAMTEASDRYDRIRRTQKRTTREETNWPKGGYAAMKKLAAELRDETEHVAEKAPRDVTATELYAFQRYFVILFYAYHTLRGDLGDVRIKPGGMNYLQKRGASWSIHIGQHKTVRSHGAIEFKLAAPVQKALDIFIPIVRANTKHGFLLSTMRDQKKLSRKDMMIMIRRTTKKRLGKNIGIQLLRVLKTTSELESIDKASELRQELAHSSAMQQKYVSRS